MHVMHNGSFLMMQRRKLINTHNTKQKPRFPQHQEAPKIKYRVQCSIEKYKNTIFNRRGTETLRQRPHKLPWTDRMDSRSVANLKV